MMTFKRKGFSYIELLIAVAIVSIITIVAISVYTGQSRRGRRMDGINSLLAISLAQEHYRSSNSTYGTLAQVWGGVTTSSEGFYTLAISGNTATAYTVTATAAGDQANDQANGVSCTTLTLAVSNGAVTKTPTVCWPT